MENDILKCLKTATHGKRLTNLGDYEDFRCCSELDCLDIVPAQVERGVIRAHDLRFCSLGVSLADFLVAALQITSTSNVEANFVEAEEQIELAARRGAELIGLPENFAFLEKMTKTAISFELSIGVQIFKNYAQISSISLRWRISCSCR